MAVFRVEKNKNYTTVANYVFRDKRLTWKAKGLLANMLSLPENWDYSLAGLTTLSKDGETTTRGALKELEEGGYLIRNPIREKGKFVDWEYIIFEKPQKAKPVVEKPQVDKPHVEKPVVENQGQLNTNKSNTEKSITNKSSIKEEPAKKQFKKPSVDEVREYCKERKNNIDPERFVDYYTAKGWKIGKQPMKDWKAAVRTWEKNNFDKTNTSYDVENIKKKVNNFDENDQEFDKWLEDFTSN